MDPYDNKKASCKNGKKQAQVITKNGKPEGIRKSWSGKGVLLEEAEYKNGMLHGNFKTYQPDGKVKVVHIPMANRIKNKASGRRIFWYGIASCF